LNDDGAYEQTRSAGIDYVALLESLGDEMSLEMVLKYFKYIEIANKSLQTENMDLKKANKAFNYVKKKFEMNNSFGLNTREEKNRFLSYLMPGYSSDVNFEVGVQKVLNNSAETLSPTEKRHIKAFLLRSSVCDGQVLLGSSDGESRESEASSGLEVDSPIKKRKVTSSLV